jgi:raffinose/stachyose/melibiose transport system substrate-binding protein
MRITKMGVWTLLCCLLLVLAGCSGAGKQGGNEGNGTAPAAPGNNGKQETEQSAKPVTLKLAMWDSNNDFITYLTDKVKEFTTVMPHVKVEVESFKSDGDYLQAIKVRAGGDALPDIIELKPNWLSDFKEQLLPLDELSAAKSNLYASKYAVDGNVLAIPTVSFPELVYYHPSVFEKLNLEVPTTWPDFISALTKIKEDGTYIPYAMGGKDAWPNYPFNEFLPHIISGNENYLSDMAKEDAPFGQGTSFYEGFSQIAELYNAGVMGPDPLGVGWDQATDLFVSGQAAVVASGLWFLPTYESKTGGTDDLAAFPMPYRMTAEAPLQLMMFTDHFYGISNSSKHQEEAKAFLEWFYSPEVYQTYLDQAQLGSTYDGVEANVPFLKAFNEQYNPIPFLYIPGDEAYTMLSNSIQLDVKALGQEMMSGRTGDDIAADLNAKWEKARKNQ